MARATLLDDDVDPQAPIGTGAPAGLIRGPGPVPPQTSSGTVPAAAQDCAGRIQTPAPDPGIVRKPPPDGRPGPKLEAEIHPGDRHVDVAQLWPKADRPAVDFVMLWRDIPRSRFFLRRGERIVDIALYRRRLTEDLTSGPSGPCAKTAIRDAHQLRRLFGRPSVTKLPRPR